MSACVALLRGINVGGHKPVPMAELRALCEGLGLTRVATYIQSGNLVFSSTMSVVTTEAALERAIAKRFGFPVEVVVRAASDWLRYAATCPFPDAARDRPSLVLLGLSKAKPNAGARDAIAACAKAGERVAVDGDAVWIDYAASVGRSKITPAVLDRAVGSSVTARNWNTVQELAAMLVDAGGSSKRA